MVTVRSESMVQSGQHRQPDGQQPPERTQPDSDLAWEGWQQPRGRRPLRLIAAIGAITGGLCVVLAMIGLVVEFGSGRPDAGKPAVGKTVHTYTGSGTRRPRPIQVPRAGLYGVAWSFSCPPGRSGAFTMKDGGGRAASKAEVAASGPHGKGTWWERRDRPVRSLYVVADCSWKALVVRPATGGTPAPHSGRGAAHKPEHPREDHGHENHAYQGQGHANQGQANQGHANQGQANSDQGNPGQGHANQSHGNQNHGHQD